MSRHTLTNEIRRVVARLGGSPPVHAAPAPEVVVSRLETTAEREARPVPVAIDASLVEVERPGSSAAALTVPPLEARASDVARPFAPTAHRADPPPSASACRGVPLLEASAAAVPAVAVPAPPSSTVDIDTARASLRHGDRPFQAHRRTEPPLPARAAPRRFARPPRALCLVRRARTPATTIDRERLAGAWATLLREHPVAADDVAFVGMYGPLPLGALVGARVEREGSVLVELRPGGRPGPLGDLVMAIHHPTSRVLRTAYPRHRGPGGRLR